MAFDRDLAGTVLESWYQFLPLKIQCGIQSHFLLSSNVPGPLLSQQPPTSLSLTEPGSTTHPSTGQEGTEVVGLLSSPGTGLG